MKLKRTLHFWSWIGIRIVGLGLVFSLVFGIIFGFFDETVSSIANMMAFYMLLFGVFLGMSGQIAAVQVYIAQALSMGETRKNAFIGLQYMNVFIAGLFYIISLAFQYVMGRILNFHEWDINVADAFILYITAVLIIDALANLFSMLILRIGKWGMIIVSLFAGVCGGMLGMILGNSQDGSLFLKFPFLSQVIENYAVPMIVVSFGVYVVCGIAQYVMVRKYEIRA